MSSHLGDTLLCLDSGRNVLCEKSMTLNSEQLAKMFERAHEKDLFLMEAMWMKCRPSFLKAREWIQAGRIGNVKAMNREGEQFETPKMMWNQQTHRVFSDTSIHITRETSIIEGVGFDSNEQMTQYSILHPTGVFPIKDE
jgi:predicted dehydrogenase